MLFDLPYGSGFVQIHIPDSHFVRVLTPDSKVLEHIDDSIMNNVREKINDRICQLCGNLCNEKKIVILVPDITRKCSQSLIVETVVKAMEKCNKKVQHIIIATGNHRGCSEEEFEILVGKYVLENYRDKVVNHNSKSSLTYIGTTKYGNDIFINSRVAKADMIIIIGNVIYHNFAGYSGGRKLILPGVAGSETIGRNHRLMLDNDKINPSCDLGSFSENPVHNDMMEASGLLENLGKKIIYINMVTNIFGEPIEVFCGTENTTFIESVKKVDNLYCIKINSKANLVVCSSGGYPFDINFYQSFKSLMFAKKVVRDNGTIVLVSECREGLGEEYEKFSFWFNLKPKEIITNLYQDFDTVGQIAYWVKHIQSCSNLVVFTENKNVSTFNSLGIETVDIKHLSKFIEENIARCTNGIFVAPHSNVCTAQFLQLDN